MNRSGAWIVLLSWGAAACGASVPPPREREAVSEATVRQARESGAQESQEGVLKLQLAEEQLENARALMRAGQQADAARVLVRGQADADLALAIAHENKTRTEANLAIDRADNARAKTAIGAGTSDDAVAKPSVGPTASQGPAVGEANPAGVEDRPQTDARSLADRDKKAREALEAIPVMGIGTVRLEERGTVITMLASAVFVPDTANIVPAAGANLDVVADALGSPSAHRVTIQSYGDSQGAKEASRALCEQQARAVMDYLVSRGVPSGIVRAEGLGAARPIADNGTISGRAKNRRVEIVITPETSHASP